MIYELIPWRTLTRTGIPPLKVSRRALEAGGVLVQVGETFDPELFPLAIRKERLRQFYEQRRLEPVEPPFNSRQYWRERRGQLGSIPTPALPIVPVASRIVANPLPVVLPDLGIPVPESRDLDRFPQRRGRGRPMGSTDKKRRKHRRKKPLPQPEPSHEL